MLKLLKRVSTKEWILLLVSVAFIMGQVLLELSIPTYMSEITRKLVTPGTQIDALYGPGGMMLLLSLCSFAAALVVGYIAAYLGASVSRTLRRDVFSKIMGFSSREANQFSVPSLITRTTNDIVQIQLLIAQGLQVVIRGPIMAIWAISKISDKNGDWLIVTAVAVVTMLIGIFGILYFVFPKQTKIQSLTDQLNKVSRENISGVRVIRAYNAQANRHGHFQEVNDSLTNTQLFTMRLFSLFGPLMNLVNYSLTLAVYWVGAYIIDAASLENKVDLFAEMSVFTSYAMQIVFAFIMMTMIFMFLPRALVSARRINEVLDTEYSIQYPSMSQSNQDRASEDLIEFKQVTFQYSDGAEPVIQDINFKVKRGQTLAFIGSTGSGKSTLVNLINRFYDVSKGAIYLKGQNIRDYSQEDLNNLVTYIPQKPLIFSGTIGSNLDFGSSQESPLTQEKMEEAIRIAQAAEFVASKEDGLNSHVAQSGSNLSGGQRQRLAIARAIARKPEVLIFDDSFSALDYKTDKALRQSLKEETTDLTKLIVAQRISTIMDADLIIVLDQGKIVGKGRHEELLKTNSVYQEIAYSQLSKEELENG